MNLPKREPVGARLATRCAGLFLLLAALYGVTASGTVGARISDGRSMYAVTAALVDRGAVNVPPELGVRGRDGRSYSKYGVGQSLAAVPFYLAGRAVATREAPTLRSRTLLLAGSLLNPLVLALLCALLPLLAAGLGVEASVAPWLGVLAGLCTPLWPYAGTFFGEPLIGLCLVAAVLGLARGGRRGMACCGVALGVAVLARLDSMIYVPVLLLAALCLPTHRVSADRLRAVLLVMLPIAVALAVVAWYNVSRFGSPLESGYGRGAQGEAVDVVFTRTPGLVTAGIWNLLASPGKGLIFYAPVVLLAPFGAWLLWRARRRWELCVLLGLCGVDTVAHANLLIRWLGGWAWGPRFLVPILPLAVILAGAAGRRSRPALVALGLLGLLVQAPAVVADIHPYLEQLGARYGSPYRAEAAYVPSLALSPIMGQWAIVLDPARWRTQRDWGHRAAEAVAGLRLPHYAAPLPRTWWGILASEGVPWQSWALPLGLLALVGIAGGVLALRPPNRRESGGRPREVQAGRTR